MSAGVRRNDRPASYASEMERPISARARLVRDGLSDGARAALKILLGTSEAERAQGTYVLGLDGGLKAAVVELADAGCVRVSGQSVFISELGEDVLHAFNELSSAR
jgi:hypothetical protein